MGSPKGIWELDDTLTFGKHEGQTVGNVIENDPSWVVWARNNIVVFELADETEAALEDALAELQEAAEDQAVDRFMERRR